MLPARVTIALSLVLVLLLSGCGAYADMNDCRKLADDFAARLSKGDYLGAYEMCDPDALNHDTLQRIVNENPGAFDNFAGIEHGEGGNLQEKGDVRELRLAPANLGPKHVVHFMFRDEGQGWKVVGFRLEPKP
jgi:hypothetical protein